MGHGSEAAYDDVMGRAEDDAVDWMFSPPSHLSFAGNYEMALGMCNSDRKWLLVNVQYHEEFSSHMLNRDTWCDETVEQIVRSSFIFWQRGSTCTEAKKCVFPLSVSVSISRSITVCLRSLTPQDTSLTIVPPTINHHRHHTYIPYYNTGTSPYINWSRPICRR